MKDIGTEDSKESSSNKGRRKSPIFAFASIGKGFAIGFVGASLVLSFFMLDLKFRQDVCRTSGGTLCIFLPRASDLERP